MMDDISQSSKAATALSPAREPGSHGAGDILVSLSPASNTGFPNGYGYFPVPWAIDVALVSAPRLRPKKGIGASSGMVHDRPTFSTFWARGKCHARACHGFTSFLFRTCQPPDTSVMMEPASPPLISFLWQCDVGVYALPAPLLKATTRVHSTADFSCLSSPPAHAAGLDLSGKYGVHTTSCH